MTKVFAILDKEKDEFVTMPSGKCAWPSERAAKSAYTCHMGPNWHYKDRQSYNEQERFVVVDLTEAYFRLEGLMR
jgi:hypothetical protein